MNYLSIWKGFLFWCFFVFFLVRQQKYFKKQIEYIKFINAINIFEID